MASNSWSHPNLPYNTSTTSDPSNVTINTDQPSHYPEYGSEPHNMHEQTNASPAYNPPTRPRGNLNPTARVYRGGAHRFHQPSLISPGRGTSNHARKQTISRQFQAQVTASLNRTSGHHLATPTPMPATRATRAARASIRSSPMPSSSTQALPHATPTAAREPPHQRIDHLHNIRRELLISYQRAATAVREAENELEGIWRAADVRGQRDDIYAKEANLEVLRANYDTFGRMYVEVGEDVEDEWTRIYQEQGSIRG